MRGTPGDSPDMDGSEAIPLFRESVAGGQRPGERNGVRCLALARR